MRSGNVTVRSGNVAVWSGNVVLAFVFFFPQGKVVLSEQKHVLEQKAEMQHHFEDIGCSRCIHIYIHIHISIILVKGWSERIDTLE